jgi:dolichol-phosphate hexosyltransferase
MAHPPHAPRGEPRLVEGSPPFDPADAAVVLPTLNEADGVGHTIQSLPLREAEVGGWKIRPILVDGGSTDGTVSIATGLGVPVLRQSGRGKGAAIREALRWLRVLNVRYAIVLDADHTYPGEAIGPALSLLATGSELVIGVRRPLRTPVRTLRDAVHRLGNAFLNFTASRMSGDQVLDLCSGFWAIDLRSDLDRQLAAEAFDIEAELFLRANRQGRRVTQIPIQYRKRIGEAKLRTFRDGFRIFLTVLRFARPSRLSPPEPSGEGAALFRSILSVCFANGARQLTIISDPSRQSEAETLIAKLRGTRIEAALTVLKAPDRVPLETASGPPGRLRSVSPSAIVILPESNRMVYFEGAPAPEREPEPFLLPIAGGARSGRGGWIRESTTAGPRTLEWLREIAPNFGRAVRERELSFFGANDPSASLAVWRDRSDEGSQATPTLYLPARKIPD